MGIDDTQNLPGNTTQQLPKTVAVRQARRIVLGVVGGGLLIIGAILLPLPGPFTIPPVLLGLTVLSWEFPWAKRLLVRIKMRLKKIRSR
ncbi:MAG: PGPGW domain-containing protein [Actinomycetota bacterium]